MWTQSFVKLLNTDCDNTHTHAATRNCHTGETRDLWFMFLFGFKLPPPMNILMILSFPFRHVNAMTLRQSSRVTSWMVLHWNTRLRSDITSTKLFQRMDDVSQPIYSVNLTKCCEVEITSVLRKSPDKTRTYGD